MTLEVGAIVLPTMTAAEMIDTIVAAEGIGLDYCLVADESLLTDPYVVLGAAARLTSRIRLGPVTNGYTRHPAVSAAGIATLNSLSGGRAVAALVAGGSMALGPLGIERAAPLTVVGETIEVMKRLWSGEAVTWHGDRFCLDDARLGPGPQDIPLWIAARGPRLLSLAGRAADGVILEVGADLAGALALVDEGTPAGVPHRTRIYLDQLAYRPDLRQGTASEVFVHVLMDSPTRQLHALGLTDPEIAEFRGVYRSEGAAAAADLIPPDVVRRHQIVGTPEECRRTLGELAARHELDAFFFYVKSPGLEANVALMTDVHRIAAAA